MTSVATNMDSTPTASPPWPEIFRLLQRAGCPKLISVAVAPPPGSFKVADQGLKIEPVTELAALAEYPPCPAVLLTTTDYQILAKDLAAVHPRLTEDGRLLIWGCWQASRMTGGLEPAGHEEAVRQLSETGFSVIEELLLDSGAQQPGIRRTSLIVARPETSVVRGYQAGDEIAIADCFRACFQVERSLEQWRWKYLDNPYGGPLISLAFEQDRLLAQYAGYPLPLHLGPGPPALAVQMGDTMTAPQARSVGRRSTSLLRRAVRHFFATYSEPEVAYYYGFNTGAIHRFSKRFVRGQRHSQVSFWQRDAKLPRLRQHYRVKLQQHIQAGFDRFWRRTARRYGVLLQRDACYLSWRYQECPDVDYQIFSARRWGRLVGWGVFRRQGRILAWGDAMFDPRHCDAASDVLRAALSNESNQGVEEITAWFPEHPGWWRRTVAGLGFARATEPEDLALVYRPHATRDIQQRLESLYYTMGDSDLF